MLNINSIRALGRAAVGMTIGVGILAGSPAFGQQAGSNPPDRTNRGVIVQLQFPGGTLEAFVELLRAEVEPIPINVLYRNGAEFAEIPSVRLHNIYVRTALQSAIYGSTLDFGIIESQFGSIVYVISGEVESDSSIIADVVRAAEILTVGDLFAQGSTQISDVLEAIDVAVFDGRQRPEPPPEIRFHEPSGLLIVRGTAAQVATIAAVVDQLSNVSMAQRDRERNIASERIEREAKIVDLKVQIRIMDERFQVEMSKVNRLVELRKAGVTGSMERVEAQLSMVTLALEQEKASNRLRAAEAQLALLDRGAAVDRSEKTYEFGEVMGATSELQAALAAISALWGPKIDLTQTENELTVNATKGQHAVVAAVIDAMREAADQGRD